MPEKLLLAMGGICGLRPAHSYFAGGVQLPLEARMVGIFAGFSLTLFALLLGRRLNARMFGSCAGVIILVLFFASMVLDGLNSTLYEFQLPHLYAPSNPLRLGTGLLAGIAAAPFMVWLVALVALPPGGERRVIVRSWWEPITLLALAALFAALVMSEQAAAYLPAALLSVGGVVAMLTMAALALLIYSSPLRERVSCWRQLLRPAPIALLVALAVLAGSAAVRWSGMG